MAENRTELKGVALMWHSMDCPVIPVVFRPKKSGQGTDKIPIIEYEHWKNGKATQTVEDVQNMPWDRAQGVAILLWPTSNRIVVDEDGVGADHLLLEAGITLPPTGLMHTPTGGRHHHLLVPPGTPPPDPNAVDRDKRTIRLLHATDNKGKPCKPAIDFLFNGIVVVAGPGYREDPDYPLDSTKLAVLPQAVWELARAKSHVSRATSRDGNRSDEYATLMRGVPLGIQHDSSIKLIGHLILRLRPNEVWAIMEDWCDRCDPPADKQKVRAAFEDILKREQAKEKEREPEGPDELPAEAPETYGPEFPEAAYVGLASEVSAAFSERLEAPRQFFYLDYLTFLGAMVCRHVSLNMQLREEPRIYLVKVGESWIARKSSSQKMVRQFFEEITRDRVRFCYGVGSAEGLARILNERLPAILLVDEFRALVQKCSIQGSVLLPMITTLFQENTFENMTKQTEVRVTDASLSILGACTADTFRVMFTPEFRAIGALNRLFLVTGRRQGLQAIPERIPPSVLEALQQRTEEQIERIEQSKPLLHFTPEARRLWTDYYHAMPDSFYAARLDTYGLRFMQLLAVTSEKPEVDAEVVRAVIALLDYEFQVRRELDPADADNTVARYEHLVLRYLLNGRMTDSRLRDYLHVEREGIWFYDKALENLRKHKWVESRKIGKGTNHWLTDAGREEALRRERQR